MKFEQINETSKNQPTVSKHLKDKTFV